MERVWGSVFPLVYTIVFALTMKQYSLQFTPLISWVFVGGVVLSSSAGIYLDGRMPLRSVFIFGLFTLIWLLIGIRHSPPGNWYVLGGISGYFLLAILMQRTSKPL
ncbi:hypothetical protein [Thermococcus camini]|uniref:Uncharacterized protein n=1 Tax=Thermococcus camini TaxID=2016373 RepID=A0A7G2D6I1_9EURY|nr:hypothetical protein [Thermococcus camini]CAD5243982.1 conserved membrane protein of unknown function [Thermococcus camini]